MVRHFFINKSATIVKGSDINTSLNPVLSLVYGNSAISRGVISFDLKEIFDWMSGNTLNPSKLKFYLHMTNYGSVDLLPTDKDILTTPNFVSKRSSSFDLSIFDIRQEFETGNGYDFAGGGLLFGSNETKSDGVTWNNATNVTKWLHPGIYNHWDTEVITKQHFSTGLENLHMNITEYLLEKIFAEYGTEYEEGEENKNKFYGIGIKFSTEIEDMVTPEQQYVGFFTDNTNLLFHPYVEAIYEEHINDVRYNFDVNKENNLYLYVNDDGVPVNLDEWPSCSIGTVGQVQTGVYKTTIQPGTFPSEKRIMAYDVWSNLSINGVRYDDIEQEFSTIPTNIGINKPIEYKSIPKPIIKGIEYGENVNRSGLRALFVDFKEMYTTDRKVLLERVKYRIYTKYNKKDYTIFDYHQIEKSVDSNYFVINMEDLIPGEYFIEILCEYGMNRKSFMDVLKFSVASETN